ncbi:MAG: prepilin-type N-terminal cleavage/methylation domain-containing protein [Candidatus Methylomirabilia bacterium]
MNNKGFSLIELVIVIVILGIASVGLMTVFSTGTKKSADPLLENQALQLAQEKMEIIIGQRMDVATPRGFAWVVAADYSANPAKYPPETPVAAPFAAFNRSVTITCVTSADLNTSTGAPPCASGYARVTVAVAHAALSGSVTADTLLTDY